MAKYESSISNKEFDNTPSKHFIIDDESDNLSQEESLTDVEMKIKEARIAKRDAGKYINPAAKKRVEIISGLGRATKDIPVDGMIFSIRTLKGNELRAVVKATMNTDQAIDQMFESRTHTLARSIYKIDGSDIEFILNDPSLEAKLSFVEELDDVVLQYIYKEYDNLVTSHKKKYASVEEEIGEISNDLTKSS